MSLNVASPVHESEATTGELRRAPRGLLADSVYTMGHFTSREDVKGLEKCWRALEERTQGSAVFQNFDLCFTWLKAYVFGEAPSHTAHVFVFYDADKNPVALVPLAQKISGFAAMAEWIGEPLVQYGDILLDPDCNTAALKEALEAALQDLPAPGIHLRNVRTDARILDVLDLNGAEVGEQREAAIADLGSFGTAEEYFGSLSKRSKKNIKTKRRKLAVEGELTFEVIDAGPRAADLCALAINWKMTWLAARGISSRAFMDCRALGVLRSICANENPGNPIKLFVQKLADQPVAIGVGFVGTEGNAAFLGTYDPALEHLSAGKVQIESAILYGFEKGWPAYDMLAPLDDYKVSWATRTVPLNDYALATNLKGMIYRDGYLRAARPAAKAVWNAIPAVARTKIVQFKNQQVSS